MGIQAHHDTITYPPNSSGAVNQKIGYNLGRVGYQDWAQYFVDFGPTMAFYSSTGGTFNDAGEPTGGTGSLTWFPRPDVVNAQGTYEYSWTGGATINGQSSPQTVVVTGATDQVVFNYDCTAGPLQNFSLKRQGQTGTYDPNSLSDLQRGIGYRVMEGDRINEPEYDSTKPYVRVVPLANVRHHRLATPTVWADLAQANGKQYHWVCSHHKSTDANVTALATELAGTSFVSGGGTIIWEFSNETWNSSFGQYDDLLAIAQGISTYDALGDLRKVVAYAADETSRLGGLVKAQLPTAKVVFGVWTNQTDTDIALDTTTTGHTNIDYFGATCYFGGPPARAHTPASIVGMTDAQFVEEARQDWLTRVIPALLVWKSQAQARGKVIIGYEGGPHLDNTDPVVQDRLNVASRSTEMGVLMGEVLDWWHVNMGTPIFLFQHQGSSSGNSSFWSFREGPLGVTLPKWQAFLDRVA